MCKIISANGPVTGLAGPESAKARQVSSLSPRFGPTTGRNGRRHWPDEILTIRVQLIDNGPFVDSELAVCIFKVACGTLTYRQQAAGSSKTNSELVALQQVHPRQGARFRRVQVKAADECGWLQVLGMRPKAAGVQDVLGFHGVIGLIRLV